MFNKKGMSLNQVPMIVITLVVIALVLGVGSTLLSDTQTDQVTATYHCGLNSTNGTSGTLLYDGCGFAYNASQSGLEGLDTVSGWQDNIALIVVFAVILALIAGFLIFRR